MADEAETIQIGEAAIDHLITITAPPLVLEVYSEDLYRDDFDWLQKLKSVLFRLRPLWRRFYGILQEENIPQDLGLSLEGGQQWEVDLNFVSNETIRRLNREFRNKDAATDVLSFTLLGRRGGTGRCGR
jgi:hypothetical protein